MKTYIRPFAVLASVLLMSSLALVPPAGADVVNTQPQQQEFTQEQAVQFVRARLKLPAAEWKLTQTKQTEFRYGQDATQPQSQPQWDMLFSGPHGETTNAVITARDHLIRKIDTKTDIGGFTIGALTREEAQKLATEALSQVAPELASQLVFRETFFDPERNRYCVSFERRVQGLYVLGDEAVFEFRTDATLAHVSISWHSLAFPDVTPTIPLEKVRQSYRDALDLRLRYADENLDPSVRLVYQSKFTTTDSYLDMLNLPIFDATTGQMLNSRGNSITPLKIADDSLLELNGTPSAFTPDQAERLLQGYGLLPSDATLQPSESPSSDHPDLFLKYVAGSQQISAQLDKTTGALLSFTNYGSERGAALPPENLRQKAIDAVTRIYGNRELTLQVQATTPKDAVVGSTLSVKFLQVLHGVPSLTRSITVELNKSTGQVTSIYNRMDDHELTSGPSAAHKLAEYPQPNQLPTVEQAKDLYVQNRPLRLSYMFPRGKDNDELPPVLVYAPQPQSSIWGDSTPLMDAQTGTVRPEFLDILSFFQPTALPSTMNGHWAQDALRLFQERGVTRFVRPLDDPDQELTRAELVTLITRFVGVEPLVAALLQPLPYADVPLKTPQDISVYDAYWYGWIAKDTNFRPADKITREEAATIISRVISTQLPVPADKTLPYVDAASLSPWAVSAVAQHNLAGLMRGDNTGHFNPQQHITFAEACTLLTQMSRATHVIPYDLARLKELAN